MIDRVRRPFPERLGPYRNPINFLNSANSSSEAAVGNKKTQSETDTGDSASDFVGDGVRMGYGVIEEQIRLGRQLAENFSGQLGGSTGGNVDPNADAVSGILRLYTDVGSACIGALETFTRSQATQNTATENPQAAGTSGTHNSATKIRTSVHSQLPVEIEVSLNGNTQGEELVVHALFALDRETPPLYDSTITVQPSGDIITVSVSVPPHQKSDSYSGAIVSAIDNSPVGTLSVVVLNAE